MNIHLSSIEDKSINNMLENFSEISDVKQSDQAHASIEDSLEGEELWLPSEETKVEEIEITS